MYIFSRVTKRLQPTNPIGERAIWDMYGFAISYVSDILIHMFVLVIETLNVFCKVQRVTSALKIIPAFSSLYHIEDIGRNDSRGNSRVKE